MHEIKTAHLSEALALPYVEQGDAFGIPVVHLHAYADSWRSYEPVLAHLPASIHAFAVTQRGHGDADRPISGYELEHFTADLAAFMDVVGLEAAVLVGDSSAAYTAQRFALDHPRRTLGLGLIGPPRSLREDPRFAAFIRTVSELEDPIDPAFVRQIADRAVAQPVSRAFVEAMIGEGLKLPARVWRAVREGHRHEGQDLRQRQAVGRRCDRVQGRQPTRPTWRVLLH